MVWGVAAYLRKVCRPELEVRRPTWYCAIRRTRMARPQRKMKEARMPVGPTGKTAQKTVSSVRYQRIDPSAMQY